MEGDGELVAAMLAGESAAARSLYERHGKAVWRLALRVVQRTDLADDCVQETFIRAFDHIAELRDPGSFGAWLMNIAYRVAVDVVRSELRHKRAVESLPAADTFEELPDVLLRAMLIDCVDQMNEIYREVFVLYALVGLKHSEIATLLHIAVGSSKRRFSEARRQLRRMLKGNVGRPNDDEP